MADLVYGGGGTTYSPPPTGGTGDTSGGGSNVDWFDGYNTTQGYVAAADPIFNNDFFATHLNATNPYNKTYSQVITGSTWQIIGYDQYGMPIMKMVPYSYVVYPTNPAYTDFENRATTAQNTHLQQQTDANKIATDAAQDLYIKSFGNVKTPSIKSDIVTLSELKELYTQLKFQQDITKFLNRVPDVNNISQMLDLENRIKDIERNLSQDLMDYWRQQEIIRKKENESFTWDFKWLSDPYFGRGGGDQQQHQPP